MTSDVNVKIGDEDVSLAALGGVDMSEVEEVRFVTTPAGIYQWKINNAELAALEVTDKDGNKANKPVCKFELEATNCFGLADDSKDVATGIGQKHNETMFISDLEKDIGRIKAFLVDTGLEGSGTLQALLDKSVGHEFIAPIKIRSDKNDKDKKYANIDFGKVKSLDAME